MSKTAAEIEFEGTDKHSLARRIQIALHKSLETGTQLPTTRDEIVVMAYDKGWIKTGAQRNADAANTTPQAQQ